LFFVFLFVILKDIRRRSKRKMEVKLSRVLTYSNEIKTLATLSGILFCFIQVLGKKGFVRMIDNDGDVYVEFVNTTK